MDLFCVVVEDINRLKRTDSSEVHKYSLYEKIDKDLFELFCCYQWNCIKCDKNHDDEIKRIVFLSERLASVGRELGIIIESCFTKENEVDYLLDIGNCYPHILKNMINKFNYSYECEGFYFKLLNINPIQGFQMLFNHFSWGIKREVIDVEIVIKTSQNNSATCLLGYNKDIKVLWNKHNKYQDVLTVCHELGHVLHYRLAMEEQSFYYFEPIEIIRETFAFFFEGIALFYLCYFSDEKVKKLLVDDFKKQRENYLSSNSNYIYGSYYHNAIVLSDILILGYIESKIKQKDIWSLMKMGGRLNTKILYDFLEEKGCLSEYK